MEEVKNKVNEVKNQVINVAQQIKDGAGNLKEFARKKTSEVLAYAKEQMMKVFQPLIEEVNKIKEKFIRFLRKNPLIAKLMDFCNCFLNNPKAQTTVGL